MRKKNTIFTIIKFFPILLFAFIGCIQSSKPYYKQQTDIFLNRLKDFTYRQKTAEKKASQIENKAHIYMEKGKCDKVLEAFKEAEVENIRAYKYLCRGSNLHKYDQVVFPICDKRIIHYVRRLGNRTSYRYNACMLHQDPIVGPFLLNDSSDSALREGLFYISKKDIELGFSKITLAAYSGNAKAAFFLGNMYLDASNADKAVYWFSVASMLSKGKIGNWELLWEELAYDLKTQKGAVPGHSIESFTSRIDRDLEKIDDPDKSFYATIAVLCDYEIDYKTSRFMPVDEKINFSEYKIKKLAKLAQSGHKPSQEVLKSVRSLLKSKNQSSSKRADYCKKCYQKYWSQNVNKWLQPWVKAYNMKKE